jgi:hypothetical protein
MQIDVHEVHQNIVVKRDGEGIEIDLLVVNNIECKSNLNVSTIVTSHGGITRT